MADVDPYQQAVMPPEKISLEERYPNAFISNKPESSAAQVQAVESNVNPPVEVEEITPAEEEAIDAMAVNITPEDIEELEAKAHAAGLSAAWESIKQGKTAVPGVEGWFDIITIAAMLIPVAGQAGISLQLALKGEKIKKAVTLVRKMLEPLFTRPKQYKWKDETFNLVNEAGNSIRKLSPGRTSATIGGISQLIDKSLSEEKPTEAETKATDIVGTADPEGDKYDAMADAFIAGSPSDAGSLSDEDSYLRNLARETNQKNLDEQINAEITAMGGPAAIKNPTPEGTSIAEQVVQASDTVVEGGLPSIDRVVKEMEAHARFTAKDLKTFRKAQDDMFRIETEEVDRLQDVLKRQLKEQRGNSIVARMLAFGGARTFAEGATRSGIAGLQYNKQMDKFERESMREILAAKTSIRDKQLVAARLRFADNKELRAYSVGIINLEYQHGVAGKEFGIKKMELGIKLMNLEATLAKNVVSAKYMKAIGDAQTKIADTSFKKYSNDAKFNKQKVRIEAQVKLVEGALAMAGLKPAGDPLWDAVKDAVTKLEASVAAL